MAREYTAKVPITWQQQWAANGQTYLDARVTADVKVSIDPGFTRAHCTLENYTEAFTPGSAKGGGFVNIGGIAWHTYDFGRHTHPLADAGQDSFSRAWNELYSACPDLHQTMIVGVACDDKNVNYDVRKGSSWNSYDIPLNGDPNSVRGLVVANGFMRWYWHGSDAPGGVKCSVVDYRSEFKVAVAPEGSLEFLYFPWAVYQGGWKSCDRDGGSYQWMSGGWQDRKNSLTDDSKTTVWYMKNGGWAKAPLIGDA